MQFNVFALATILATIVSAAPINTPQKGPELALTGPLGTIGFGTGGSVSLTPWFAPLIPGSGATAKPWGTSISPGYAPPRPYGYEQPRPQWDPRPQYEGWQKKDVETETAAPVAA